jgi:hypothetical protein
VWGSAIYGFFIGIGALLFMQNAPQPVGSILWWGFFAGQLIFGAVLCWRRTRLPLATAAMGIAAVTSGMLSVLAAVGHEFPDLPHQWWLPVGAGLVAGPLLFLVESRIHRSRWKLWRQYMEPKTAGDIFRDRHIPDMRDSRA